MRTGETARSARPVAVALRAAIVSLTLPTAYVHSTLGGPLFTATAAGYVALAAAMVVPTPFASRFRRLVRAGPRGVCDGVPSPSHVASGAARPERRA